MSKEIIESELKHYGYEQTFSDNFRLVDNPTLALKPETSVDTSPEPSIRQSVIGNIAIEGYAADQP